MSGATADAASASPAPGTVTHALASFIVGLRLEDVPNPVRREAKRILADSLGCMVAGRTTKAGRIACKFALSGYGEPRATVVGAGRSTPERAAFANTVLCNALDFEPVGPEGHVCAVAVPAALAAAESVGAAGDELLLALIVGLEVGGRVGAALRRPSSRVAGGVPPVRGTPQAVFAAVAAAARLLGLDLESTRHALGIAAYSVTLPTLRKAMEGREMPMTKYDHLAQAAQAGLDSATLAGMGFTGDRDVFEGPLGFWRFSGSLGCDWGLLTEGFGTTWVIPQTWFKRYPCILYVGPGIEAVLAVLREAGLDASDIDRIEVESSHLQSGQTIDHLDGPLDPWMNYGYNVACAVHDVRPWRDWHGLSPGVQVIAFSRRVSVARLDTTSEAPAEYWEGWAPAAATVHTRERSFWRRVDTLPLLDDAALRAKFEDNVTDLLPVGASTVLLERALDVESLAATYHLTGLLAPWPAGA